MRRNHAISACLAAGLLATSLTIGGSSGPAAPTDLVMVGAAPATAVTDLPPFAFPPRRLHHCGDWSNPQPTPSVQIQAAVVTASTETGIDSALIYAIFRGESGYNPDARNRRAVSNKGHATGLGQHLPGYWPERISKFQRTHPDSALANTSIRDITAQARVTAWMLAGGMGRIGTKAWRC